MWPFSSKKDPNALTREDRKKCWEARDSYFSCLDNAGVLKPGDETKAGACSSENKAYEQNCAKSWIEYFNQRRVIAEAQRDRLAQANTQAENTKR
ncbi:cytochrome oxidase c subunit VIb-domain-containing protein [Lentinula raphanica]|nr:cytochrome oxidase c subunit VIb-domain-containing protein [Lentinula raphanica]KAJ3821911.1 cytochrome oxidase c subunit VIb-domain-containing protein [Lentinula raphanica]KAJ3975126.1 cytochrome oxidase c subunit VIb-domain-containing protein [Lentinula raphanica]